MHSPNVQDREQAARELLTTLQLHGKRVGALLAEIFEPLLEAGEELPDYVLLQQLMARSVRATLSELLAADEAHLAVVEQIEDETEGTGQQAEPFLRARLARTETERQRATEEFDETYTGFGRVLEALYVLAGEDELAERLRPRTLAGTVEIPEPALAEAEIPDLSSAEADEDQVQRRILTRKARRPGLARWLGTRIFRRRRAQRP